MLTTLLKSIGVSDAMARDTSQLQWLWARPGLLIAGLALLVPIAWWIVRRHRASLPHLSPALRWLLTGCRVGLVLLLIVVLGGPFVRLTETLEHRPIVALLVDTSASMALPVGPMDDPTLAALAAAAGLGEADRDGQVKVTDALREQVAQMSRAELAKRVLQAAKREAIDPIDERFELRAYRFDRQTSRIGWGEGEGSTAGDEDPGQDTALGAALEQVIADAAGRQVAGIIVLSDGQSTAGPDPLMVLTHRQRVGADASTLRLFTIPVGGDRPPADVGVLDVLAPKQLAKGDTAAVVATIRSVGYDNREARVRLREGETVLDETTVNLQAGRRQMVSLTFKGDTPGSHLLTVDVGEAIDDELVKDNNRQTLSIDVDEQQWKLLYLEGYPRWDFRFMDHALRRDKGLDTLIVMEATLRAKGVAPADLPRAAGLPTDVDAWAEYHAVILGDVSRDLLPPQACEALAEAVREKGLGLIVEAGPEHMPHDFADTALSELLPVSLAEDNGEQPQPGMDAPVYAPFKMKVTAAGSMHPAFRLYDSASQDRGLWSRMPEFYWAVAANELKPAATVLAEVETAEGDRPLIVEQFAGQGRVLLIGLDSTYRWRRNVGDHLFYRFWGQALRHAARKRDRAPDRSWLDVYPARIEPGEGVTIELYAVDSAGKPLRGQTMQVEAIGGAEPTSLTLRSAGEPGLYRTIWQPRGIGDYQVRYTPVEVEVEALTAGVRVAPSGRELLDPGVDRDLMGALADASGGAMVELPRIATLPARLEGRSEMVEQTHEAELWDNWLTLVLVVGLYCTDVAIRRLTGLT